MPVRKIPMRMCIGCRERKPKRELIRVVRLANEGGIVLDPTGKASGRGAYLCHDRGDCLKRAMKSRALERALEHPVEPAVYEALQEALAAYEPEPDGV